MPAPSISLTGNPQFSGSFSENVINQLPLLMVTGLSIVVALAWDGAVKAYINYYAPRDLRKSKNPLISLIYAIIITVIILITITGIIWFTRRE